MRAMLHVVELTATFTASCMSGNRLGPSENPMKLDAMRDWLWPICGAALLLGGAAVLAYKVINGYRHASPDAFFSVQDQNRSPAASTADRSTSQATVPADVPAPQQVAAGVAPTPPMTAAPAPAAEAQDSSECAPIKSEQREIRAALNKQYSPEEGRYMQRRVRELAEQLVMLICAE
jgi:hypothetical protein